MRRKLAFRYRSFDLWERYGRDFDGILRQRQVTAGMLGGSCAERLRVLHNDMLVVSYKSHQSSAQVMRSPHQSAHQTHIKKFTCLSRKHVE